MIYISRPYLYLLKSLISMITAILADMILLYIPKDFCFGITYFYSKCNSCYYLVNRSCILGVHPIFTSNCISSDTVLVNMVSSYINERAYFTMERFDDVETCELSCTQLLHELNKIIDKNNAGFYRDDDLIILRKCNKQSIKN